MIRVLLMISVAGFVLSVGAISAAVALGGPDFVAHGGWKVADGNWGHDHWNHDRWDRDDDSVDTGPQATRTLAWSGADRLDLDLAADLRYVQAPGPATVTVTGPAKLVDHVIVRGDTIKYENRGHRTHRARLTIVVRAPNITEFDVSGGNSLTIEGYRQDRLRLDLSGNSDADLSGLKTKGASVDISGSADATIAPSDWATLDISGRGDVNLLTHPARLETDISGSGRVRQSEGSSPSPSPSPTPSPSPSPKGAKT